MQRSSDARAENRTEPVGRVAGAVKTRMSGAEDVLLSSRARRTLRREHPKRWDAPKGVRSARATSDEAIHELLASGRENLYAERGFFVAKKTERFSYKTARRCVE